MNMGKTPLTPNTEENIMSTDTVVKVTRASKGKDFIQAHPSLDFDTLCTEMVKEGLFKNNSESRDWARYIIKTHKIEGFTITTASRGRKATDKPAPEPKLSKAERKAKLQATVAALTQASVYDGPSDLVMEAQKRGLDEEMFNGISFLQGGDPAKIWAELQKLPVLVEEALEPARKEADAALTALENTVKSTKGKRKHAKQS